MTRNAIVRFVRRGRTRLEARRYLRAAARGALAGGAVGFVALVAGKLGVPMPAWVPWSLPAAGAIAGLLGAAFAPRIRLASAALFLDERLETHERLVTLVTRDPGRFGPRLVSELDGVGRLPRVALPREVALVPAALFLLFAVGLLPRANGEPDPAEATAEPVVSMSGEALAGAAPPKDVSAAVARLARGETPRASEVADLRRAVEHTLFSPEERSAALGELARAAEGDGTAAKRVAKILTAARGGGAADETSAPVTPEPVTDGSGAAAVTVYPKHRELVLAYRRALAEEKSR